MQGFGTGGGLIVAIGAQNAFVLSQGVRRNHHLIIALICIVCDAVFISAGVAGFGTAVSTNPTLSQWVAWGGAGFLFFYGLRSLRSALRGGSMDISDRTVKTLRAAIITTLAVTLLNPHFYLDTVILLGSVSNQFHGESRLYFWVGGCFCLHPVVYQPEPWGADACALVQKTNILADSRQRGVRNHVGLRRVIDNI